jgi:hypothetical protein
MNLVPRDIQSFYSRLSSDLTFLPCATLRDWEDSLISHKKPFQDDCPRPFIASSVPLQDFDLDGEDGVLQPVLTDNVISNGTPSLPAQLGSNLTPESLIALVTENIPLNSKQRLVVRRLLSDVLSWVDYLYDSSRRD